MKILFVAMTESIHTARWIRQLDGLGWDIHAFPGKLPILHPRLNGAVAFHGPLPGQFTSKLAQAAKAAPGPLRRALSLGKRVADGVASKIRNEKKPASGARLAKVIEQVRPDIVHSLEMQHGGYLTMEARRLLAGQFPAWVYTNWGADIHYFGEMDEHAGRIREVLRHLDYYTCECQRDVELAKDFGFAGEFLPVVPIAGGISLDKIKPWRRPGPISDRKIIMLKGYHGWVYRSDVAIEALRRCGDALDGYVLRVYLASGEIKDMLKSLTRDTGLPHEIIPYSSHEEILREHGQARVSIGLSHSDGVSTSFLEALAMGSFPIQSCTACADEWVVDGQTGFIVPPDDPEKVAQALRRALVNDDLVDQAAHLNWLTAKAKLDLEVVAGVAVDFYKHVYTNAGSRVAS